MTREKEIFVIKCACTEEKFVYRNEELLTGDETREIFAIACESTEHKFVCRNEEIYCELLTCSRSQVSAKITSLCMEFRKSTASC